MNTYGRIALATGSPKPGHVGEPSPAGQPLLRGARGLGGHWLCSDSSSRAASWARSLCGKPIILICVLPPCLHIVIDFKYINIKHIIKHHRRR